MRLIVFLTGGSRGFGRSFAEELATAFCELSGGPSELMSPSASASSSSLSIKGGAATQPADHLTVVLLSRDEEGMASTASAMSSACPGCEVVTYRMDLCDLESIESSWQTVLSKLAFGPMGAAGHDVAWLINNSGSLGPLGNLRELGAEGAGGLKALKQAIDLNVTSVMWLTSLFLRDLHAGKIVQPRPSASAAASTSSISTEASLSSAAPHAIVNVSSLCAIKAFPSQAAYCSTKAARDMLHATLGLEEHSAGEGHAYPVKTLNYAPGPLDTDMQRELRESDVLDPPTRDMFKKMKAEATLVHPNASARKCIRQLLFKENGFESGAHVDYYDLP